MFATRNWFKHRDIVKHARELLRYIKWKKKQRKKNEMTNEKLKKKNITKYTLYIFNLIWLYPVCIVYNNYQLVRYRQKQFDIMSQICCIKLFAYSTIYRNYYIHNSTKYFWNWKDWDESTSKNLPMSSVSYFFLSTMCWVF